MAKETKQEAELKACPFCGFEPRFDIEDKRQIKKGYRLGCANLTCPVTTYTRAYTDKFEAIRDWNTRASL